MICGKDDVFPLHIFIYMYGNKKKRRVSSVRRNIFSYEETVHEVYSYGGELSWRKEELLFFFTTTFLPTPA